MRNLKHAVSAIVFSSGLAMSAHAAPLVAGWDFSQYFSDSVHSIDGGLTAAPSDIRSNYSSLDPTGAAGAESAAFGAMHLPFTPVGDATEPFLPYAVPGQGSLTPNGGQGPYDNHPLLAFEGQASQNLLSMLAVSAVSIVFEADLTSVPQAGQDWQITLAGATQGSAGSISIEFSTDGSSYASLGAFSVSSNAIEISTQAQAVLSDRAFFRLTLGQGVVIDNVGISANLFSVPEPAVASLLAAGLFGLVRFGRRRA